MVSNMRLYFLLTFLVCALTVAGGEAFTNNEGDANRSSGKRNELKDSTIPVKRLLNNEIALSVNKTDNSENDLEALVKLVTSQKTCECINYSCGCCQHLLEPSIHLNSTICANVSYLSEDIGISLTVTVNDYAIFNETVSVRNPPPVCLGVPYVKEWAEACVRFYDVDATRSHLHACAQVEARMKHILIAKYELGCFDIGPIKSSAPSQTQQQLDNEPPSVMLV